MTEKLTVISERVDDIPLLMALLERMGVPALLDEHFLTHGNWLGLSLGWVAGGWLTHILSQADHWLSYFAFADRAVFRPSWPQSLLSSTARIFAMFILASQISVPPKVPLVNRQTT